MSVELRRHRYTAEHISHQGWRQDSEERELKKHHNLRPRPLREAWAGTLAWVQLSRSVITEQDLGGGEGGRQRQGQVLRHGLGRGRGGRQQEGRGTLLRISFLDGFTFRHHDDGDTRHAGPRAAQHRQHSRRRF